LKKVIVVHLNSLNIELAGKVKSLGGSVIVLHGASFPKEVYDEINDYIDVYTASSNFTKRGEETKVCSKTLL